MVNIDKCFSLKTVHLKIQYFILEPENLVDDPAFQKKLDLVQPATVVEDFVDK
jgi:hypothetical protein